MPPSQVKGYYDVEAAIRATATDDFITEEQVWDQVETLPDKLPTPPGYRVMVLLLTTPEKVGMIQTIDSGREARAISSPQGVVLKLGDMCYYDKGRYPTGPWCQVGDRVIIQKYAGRSFKLANGQILVFINEDEPAAIIDSGHYPQSPREVI